MNKIDVEELIECDYSYALINQIMKAAEKGYDIRQIDKNIDIQKLRETINEIEEKQTNNYCYLKIYQKIYNFKLDEAVLKSPTMSQDVLNGISEKINPKAYEYINSRHTNIERITQIGKQGLKVKKDIVDYLNKGYHTGQIEQIFKGIEIKFDITHLIDTSFDADRLLAINVLSRYYKRHSLKIDNNFEKIVKQKLTNKMMKKIVECLEKNSDISIIYDNNYTLNQKNTLLTALKNGLNIDTLKNPKLTTDQMNIIMVGINHNVDTSLYNNPEYDIKQMHAIYAILKYNKEHEDNQIDIKNILDPKIPAKIMEEYLESYKKDELDSILNVLQKINNYKDSIVKNEELEI